MHSLWANTSTCDCANVHSNRRLETSTPMPSLDDESACTVRIGLWSIGVGDLRIPLQLETYRHLHVGERVWLISEAHEKVDKLLFRMCPTNCLHSLLAASEETEEAAAAAGCFSGRSDSNNSLSLCCGFYFRRMLRSSKCRSVRCAATQNCILPLDG